MLFHETDHAVGFDNGEFYFFKVGGTWSPGNLDIWDEYSAHDAQFSVGNKSIYKDYRYEDGPFDLMPTQSAIWAGKSVGQRVSWLQGRGYKLGTTRLVNGNSTTIKTNVLFALPFRPNAPNPSPNSNTRTESVMPKSLSEELDITPDGAIQLGK